MHGGIITSGRANTSAVRGAFAQAALAYDVRHYVIVDPATDLPDSVPAQPADLRKAAITVYDAQQVWADVQAEEPRWLVVTGSDYPGWRAWVRPLGGSDSTEQEVAPDRARGTFRGVPPGATSTHTGRASSFARPATQPTWGELAIPGAGSGFVNRGALRQSIAAVRSSASGGTATTGSSIPTRARVSRTCWRIGRPSRWARSLPPPNRRPAPAARTIAVASGFTPRWARPPARSRPRDARAPGLRCHRAGKRRSRP